MKIDPKVWDELGVKSRQIVANYSRCRACGTVLQSLSGHDYKTCPCDNKTMVDGGLGYGRYGGVDMDLVENWQVFADEPFEKVRQHMYRTGFGKSGRDHFRITRLFEMTDEHLQAMHTYHCATWQLDLIKQEQEYRKANNISIKD